MRVFDLTTHLLDQHKADFWLYYLSAEPANDDDNVIELRG